MRFVNSNGVLVRGSRSASGGLELVDASSIQDPQRLADTLRRLISRVSELEAKQPPEAVEFERLIPASGTVSFAHGFGCPIRWFVTSWKRSAALMPVLTSNAASTDDILVLNSTVEGLAVIRIEPSQYGTKPL